jgi:anti-sigma B factor antagonist
MTDLQVQVRREGDLGFLDVNGEVRLEIGRTLDEAGRTLLGEGARHLLLDLGGVTFMDSASFGVLIQLDDEVHERAGRLVLYDLSPAVRRVLVHAGLEGRFDTAPDEAGARAVAAE